MRYTPLRGWLTAMSYRTFHLAVSKVIGQFPVPTPCLLGRRFTATFIFVFLQDDVFLDQPFVYLPDGIPSSVSLDPKMPTLKAVIHLYDERFIVSYAACPTYACSPHTFTPSNRNPTKSHFLMISNQQRQVALN